MALDSRIAAVTDRIIERSKPTRRRYLELMTQENLEGRVHWLWVGYSEMPEYKDRLTFKETSVTIPVIDVMAGVVVRAFKRA